VGLNPLRRDRGDTGMIKAVDRLTDILYPDTSPTTLDIKISGGIPSNASTKQIAERVLISEAQVKNGSAILVADIDSHLS